MLLLQHRRGGGGPFPPSLDQALGAVVEFVFQKYVGDPVDFGEVGDVPKSHSVSLLRRHLHGSLRPNAPSMPVADEDLVDRASMKAGQDITCGPISARRQRKSAWTAVRVACACQERDAPSQQQRALPFLP